MNRDAIRDLGFARIDRQRRSRTGAPEAIYCSGKTAEQVATIALAHDPGDGPLILTRAEPVHLDALAAVKGIELFPRARLAILGRAEPVSQFKVALVYAGTSDEPVALECRHSLEALGVETEVYPDVGVAGLHRLLDPLPEIAACSAVVAVAGMEGALPSVLAGLIACPIVAVPTSVGYGAAQDGMTALMAMLSSCAPGLTVVNIDNGFGAALAVHRMVTLRTPEARA